jgi:protein SCO1
MQYRYPSILFFVACSCFLLLSCRKPLEQRFSLKGKVVTVDKAQRQVTIAHEAIPGFMDAMTMPFNVKEDWALSALATGQTVEATLVVQGDRSWIEGLRISQTKDSGSRPVGHSIPELGAEVPDFMLLNQDDKPIHLAQYRGHPLLIAFVYTRCPLPDYCPRTSKNFSEIYQALQLLPPSDRKLHLLSISFDMKFDTPEVLREYAGRYMRPADFGSWEFATGSPEEIKQITRYFGVSYWRESDQIVHSMMAALIGPDGRLKRLYPGNEWTSRQILSEIQ